MKRQEIEPDYKEEGIELPQELIFADVFKILSGDAKLLYCCMRAVQQQKNCLDEDGICLLYTSDAADEL